MNIVKKLGIASVAIAASASTAVLLPASSASAAPGTCSVSVSYSGSVASAYCKSGSGTYQIEIHCTNLAYYRGNVARPAQYSASSASCGSGVVDRYRIIYGTSV